MMFRLNGEVNHRETPLLLTRVVSFCSGRTASIGHLLARKSRLGFCVGIGMCKQANADRRSLGGESGG
jgi:hypothetical protein